MLGWGVGSVGTATLLNALAGMQLYFFVDLLGMSGTIAGTIIFVSKMYDLVTDLPMGLISDRTRSPWGRRRPWMLIGALLCGLSFYWIFNPPAALSGNMIALQLGLLLLYATGYTCFNIPYIALAGEMSDDSHTRAKLMGVRVMFLQIGIAIGAIGAFSLVTAGGGGREGYGFMASIIAWVIAIPMLIAFFATRRADRVPNPAASAQATRASFADLKRQMGGVLRNRPFMVLMAIKLLHITGVASSTAAMLFLIKRVLERSEAELALKFGVPTMLATLMFIPIWLAVSRRIGKRNTWLIVSTLFIFVSSSFMLSTPEESDVVFALRGFFFGVCTAGNLLMAQAVLTDTMQHDRDVSGERREGALAGIYSSVEKFAFAFAPLLVGVLLDVSGFDRTAAVQTETAERAIYVSAALIPAIVFVLSLPVLRMYRLDETKLGKSQE
jgi:GPH family glycoside/pentoside/hexuronide:cation symporter